MASPTPAGSQTTKLGMEPNIAGALCYLPLCCIGPVFAIVAVAIEKDNRFVRFHALQSLLFAAAYIIVFGGLWMVGIAAGFVSAIVSLAVTGLVSLLGLGTLALAIVLMVKAYNNEEFVLPVIGEMAKNWI
jgi:uncharacterized membrane protein